jgi:hypothetical protein
LSFAIRGKVFSSTYSFADFADFAFRFLIILLKRFWFIVFPLFLFDENFSLKVRSLICNRPLEVAQFIVMYDRDAPSSSYNWVSGCKDY